MYDCSEFYHNADFTYSATTTSIRRSNEDSGVRRRVPPSKEEDFSHPSVSQPSRPGAHFTIPEVLRNYPRNVPFRLPCSSNSPQPQPNPIGGNAIWCEWLALPDLGRWLTKIGNYLEAAYVFVIAPPFVHDRTTAWDLERLGRRLGAFQTRVWAANAALFAYVRVSGTESISPKIQCLYCAVGLNRCLKRPCCTELRHLVRNIWTIWICLYGLPRLPYRRLQHTVL
jgi:hypothetical protein